MIYEEINELNKEKSQLIKELSPYFKYKTISKSPKIIVPDDKKTEIFFNGNSVDDDLKRDYRRLMEINNKLNNLKQIKFNEINEKLKNINLEELKNTGK